MKLSTDRILTTHVGSLPRPQDVVDLIFAQDRGEPIDQAKFDAVVQRAVDDVIKKQVEVGVDIPSDGEQSKISYATYIRHRLTGFEGDSSRPTPQDLDDFPDYRDKLVKEGHSATYKRPVCKGEIKVKSLEPVKEDIARMKAALAKSNVTEGFLNSVSPGTVAVFQPNEYYPTHQAYMTAVAEGMRAEYEEIVKSGLLLQLDCPDLAMGRHSRFKDLDEAGFPQERRDSGGSAESRAGELSRGSRAHARVLGELRRSAHARYCVDENTPDHPESQAHGVSAGRRESAA